ncbi:unnamed protein product [Macrosiphum euphorbiae]|uniref:Uncharacterized protein n=1 Tax=Macrosiphum euphorbiae TaxID=13131 RepID=A0AAV0YB87_9HEMI|nr:unnamed protein product [Macrosiphum euphorbiae]
MAQALTGHGCFESYLWRRKKAANPGCVNSPAVFDDAEHTLFVCPFWDAERADVAVPLRKPVGPEDVPYLLCGPVPQELPEMPSQWRINSNQLLHQRGTGSCFSRWWRPFFPKKRNWRGRGGAKRMHDKFS